ncbi:hypothetical protein [Streptomyces sp. NPDC059262]|uniref:ABC transporter ATP-binding protein n=1 Tax=Streptomyces sp. NPDC059262 TaxID=3346797 RepID=UPI00369F6D8D
MYLGKLVETGPAEEVYARPPHPYTRGLLDTVNAPDPSAATGSGSADGRDAVRGEATVGAPVPHPLPARAGRLRRGRAPVAAPLGADHQVACHFPLPVPE